MNAVVSGQHGDSPAGMMRMNVIARLPALAAAAPLEATDPPAATDSVEPTQWDDDPVIPPVPPLPQPKASNSFPLRSVFALAVLAAVSWTAAWWGDRQRLLAERALEARHEQTASDSRPERLARELPSGADARESVKP